MTKTFMKKHAMLLLFMITASFSAISQTKLSGKIVDKATQETLAGVNLQVKGKVVGTTTDAKGNYTLSTTVPAPFTLVISYVGYKSQELLVTKSEAINIEMEEQITMGQEIVVSASRYDQKAMEAPVTVEKMDIKAIKETAANNFYDGLANLKGIDITTQGLLFKSLNMRGFGATGNPRTVQMIDGMDNAAPGLNFPLDNIIGMPELDVESVEILPGAASALYGPNALNGLVLMNSKSPFLHQGLSAAVKTGIMSADNRAKENTPFYDASVRWAKAWNNKLALKLNLSYLAAKDWEATNYDNLNRNAKTTPAGVETGSRNGASPFYDGVNIYGDEVQADMRTVYNGLKTTYANNPTVLGQLNALSSFVPNGQVITRTGISENYLADYDTKSLKFNGALHYRINNKLEWINQFNFGQGTTMYTGTGRYSLRDFKVSQMKTELRGDALTVRAYTTQERSGDSYFMGLQAINMLNDMKSHQTWLGEYVSTYLGARAQGQNEDAAHGIARTKADDKNLVPGSAAFNALAEKYSKTPIVKGGGSFSDVSNLYHAEIIYNLKNIQKFADIQVGGNFRRFSLQSDETLFADGPAAGRTGTIGINEYGAFLQASKEFIKGLTLSASIRYDKNQNFEGQFSPRASLVYNFAKTSNFRLSYQTGFRIPTTQNQYIDLKTPNGTLIGGLEEFNSRYNLDKGLNVADLTTANIAKYSQDPNVVAAATAYSRAAITAQAAPLVKAGVEAAIKKQVTDAVAAGIDKAIAAGLVPAAQRQGAIDAEVAKQLPGALTANFQKAYDAELEKQITANLPGTLQQVLPAYALAAIPKYRYKKLAPERVASYEIGYKGLIFKKLFIDAYYYNSVYKNFIGSVSVVVPTAAAGPGLPIESGAGSANTRNAYSRPANADKNITADGFAIALNYAIGNNGFYVGSNIAKNNLRTADFNKVPELETTGFNTPEWRLNANFGKKLGSGDKIGFNVAFRTQSAFTWESSFVVPSITSIERFTTTTVPRINTLDAQVSTKLPAIKSVLKIGGNNLFGKPYYNAYGSAMVGTMYYVSLSFDELFNK
jgi:iron complex outermembrane recepter protein